jgi:mono/diheme cytochrome c family protein
MALLAGMLYVGCGADKVAPPVGAAMNEEEVKNLYSTKCGICHGADGALQYAGAKDLSMSTLPLEEVHNQIKYGKGTMPPMNKVLDDAAIAKLAAYAMTLRKVKP